MIRMIGETSSGLGPDGWKKSDETRNGDDDSKTGGEYAEVSW